MAHGLASTFVEVIAEATAAVAVVSRRIRGDASMLRSCMRANQSTIQQVGRLEASV